MRLIVKNSFTEVVGERDAQVDELIRLVTTYRNDIDAERSQMFYQMKMAKRFNNHKKYHACLARIKHLEATEVVCLFRDGTFPTGLLNVVQASLDSIQTPYVLEDSRSKPDAGVILRFVRGQVYPLRYYQQEMVNLGLRAGRGVFEAAVGTGKSLVMAYLIKELSVRSLIIVPSAGLSGQLYNDFSKWFGAASVELIDAKKVRAMKSPKAISIITIQSLASLQKSGEIQKLVSNIDAVFCDEVHHSGSNSYTSLLKDLEHVYYRFGFTGTFLRNDSKTLEMWSFLSNVLYDFPAHRAITEGFLTPMEVAVYRMGGKKAKQYQKEYDLNYCGNPELLERIHEIIQYSKPGEQVLILVAKKDKSGKIIHEYLDTLGIQSAYISGDDKKETINSTISAFNAKKFRVLIGSAVIGEGIDVRSTDHLIMAQGGKSEIIMVQAIGRGIRLFEGKSKATIHDFCFEGAKFMEKHLNERVEIYQRNFNCEVKFR